MLFLKIAVSGALLTLLASRLDLRHAWDLGRSASLWWLGAACGLYVIQLFIAAWRWGQLLRAQHIEIRARRLFSSCLVALFFNNFLPGTVGGDVIRIRDTASLAGSKTLATTVVALDRVIGLLALVLVGATAASMSGAGRGVLPFSVGWLWAGLLVALAVLSVVLVLMSHSTSWLATLRGGRRDWVALRAGRLIDALARFRTQPGALCGCFAGAVAVHVVLVIFYVAIARSMIVPVSPWNLAVIVPISFIIQALPVSLNGLGVREAAFSVCFARLGLSLESALAVSLTSAAIAAVVSLLGAVVYVVRGRSTNGREAG